MNYQKQLLKWLIENPQWLLKTHDAIFSNEPSEYFIFAAAKRVLQSGKPISFNQLKYTLAKHEALVDQINYLENETSIDKATALQIRTDLRQQAIRQYITRGANLDLNDPKTIKEYNKQLNELLLDDQPEELTRTINFEEWTHHIAPPNQYLDSGLPFLKDTGSDFKLGDLINFLAPSNEFKTGVMTHITRHQIAKGRNVLFFSMEETAQSMLSRVGHGLLKMTPYEYSQLSADQLKDRFSTMQLGKLDVCSGTAILVEDLPDLIVEEEEKNGYTYDYIVIDYSAQVKLKNAKKTSQEWQELTEVFRQLKLIAINQTNPKIIVSAIQSNREGYNKKKAIGAQNASSSMGGVHASDLLFSIRYKPNTDVPDEQLESEVLAEDLKGNVKIEVLKKRTGTIAVGKKFIFDHIASGSIRQQYVDWNDEAQKTLWDNLFADETNHDT